MKICEFSRGCQRRFAFGEVDKYTFFEKTQKSNIFLPTQKIEYKIFHVSIQNREQVKCISYKLLL